MGWSVSSGERSVNPGNDARAAPRNKKENYNNEIESQTTQEPQDQPETRRNLPLWHLMRLSARMLQLLALQLRQVKLALCDAVAALANAGAAPEVKHKFPSINRPHMHTRSVHVLELRIPPVALVLVIALLMWLSGEYAPALNFNIPFLQIVAWLIGSSGILTCTLGVVEFKRARTTVNPTKPESSSSLVTSGIYRRSRNPMYFGFLLMLASWALTRANAAAFLAIPAFVLYMNRFQIEPEERALTSSFGDQFTAYCPNVPRWI